MRISEALGINKSQLELDFYDYEIGRDTYLFLDPYYISRKEDEFLERCDEYIKTFFNRFLDLLSRDENAAYSLFSHLGEVNEICLGMSKSHPAGRGIGFLNTRTIFNAIKGSEAFRTGVASGLEDVRLFVEGVDKDKISDMVANIIKYPLIEYTQQQCALFGIELSFVEGGYYWDKDEALWKRGHQKMIVVDGKTYLLYPKNLVSASKHYSANEYFGMYILEYLQRKNIEEDSPLVRKTYDRNGNVISARVYKKDIVEDFARRHIIINKNWLSRFSRENPEVFKNFRDSVVTKISRDDKCGIDVEEFNEIIDTLVNELRSIPCGPENASRYHSLMLGILELLFYPYWNCPKREDEINEGRKRIDITFNNVAETGFWFRLSNSYHIPCSKIIIECKNYTKDIANPELDQIAGRFSPNRGRFGIICCRGLDNPAKFIESERDTRIDDRGHIIHLTDDEIIELLRKKKRNESLDDFFEQKFHEIND